MDSVSAKHLREELQSYGVAETSLRLFSEGTDPGDQDYLDLITARQNAQDSPDGVAESQGRPVLYFIEESRLISNEKTPNEVLNGVRRRVACRGERAYLARVEPGRIRVAPVAFEDIEVTWAEFTPGNAEGRTLFSRLVNGVVDWDEEISRDNGVFQRLRTLLFNSAERLGKFEEIRPDVLSLLGRALFFRFLRDRKTVTEADIPEIAPNAARWQDCFDGPENATATCKWLDETFNGDFLPLSGSNENYFQLIEKLTGDEVFNHLTAVILGAEPKGDAFQLTFDWGTFDFAHVPVGLLSQVYEDFCWHWEREEAASTSVHYTPRNIAVTLLDEAFHGLDAADQAKVLDPACGACVFLVLAFRRIYREVWKAKNRRPDRRTIRRILNRQLVGFDVSENALRLGALSLYLTALELDPRPQPLAELKFDNLRNHVLFHVRQSTTDQTSGPVLGSLGAAVGPEHDGIYDLVLCNPPWTSVPAHLGRDMQAVARGVFQRAGVAGGDRYENPDNNPDLPFLIRSSEWCKKDGRIAMALPARLLLKSERIPAEARNYVFQLIDVTGVLSGVNLSKTKVWPGTDQPFILLFARNGKPGKNPRTQLLCPHYDADLNGQGEFRIDADASRLVDPREAKMEPWLWKGWLVGSALDVEIVRKLLKHPHAQPVIKYWEELGLREGQGYVLSKKAEQEDASFLKGYPNLGGKAKPGFVLDTDKLPEFTRETLHRPRTPDIYRQPLVLLKQSAGVDRRRGFGCLAFKNVAYVSSYYGYSTAGHKDAEMLARYLHLLVHCNLWLHFGLITGAQFGAERNKLQKQSIDDFPIVKLEQLPDERRNAISILSARLTARDASVFSEIDRFFADIYGLTSGDLDVVNDTLDVGQAYRESSGHRACSPPTLAECVRFVDRLRELIAPLLEISPNNLPATLWFPYGKPQAGQTFGAILLGRVTDVEDEQFYFQKVIPLADASGASQILMEMSGGLLVGLRNHYRYWTKTRARLLGADIVRKHLDLLTP